MDELEDFYSANSEIRYITIELMKISARRKQPFSLVAREFVKNAKMLQFLIKKSAKKRKAGS